MHKKQKPIDQEWPLSNLSITSYVEVEREKLGLRGNREVRGQEGGGQKGWHEGKSSFSFIFCPIRFGEED